MPLTRRQFLELVSVLGVSSACTAANRSGPISTAASPTSTATPTARPSVTATTTATATPSPTPTPTASATPLPDDGRITVEHIEAAERIFGISLTPGERQEIVDGLNEHLTWFEALRDEGLDDTVIPSMVFNPIPAGVALDKEQQPVRFSDVEVPAFERVEDVAFCSVLQLGKLLRSGLVTSLQLTEMYLARLKRYDPALEFVVTLTEDLAREQAARADEDMRSGLDRGPLHGIPYGIKDLFSVRGYRTTWGAEPFRERVIEYNASVVDRLEGAGAVLLAKLATGRLASGDDWFGGRTRNPWNPDWGAGGSSAGPGAATAAGCVGFSIGTETNGSMVSPCDWCGVTGLRPTFGRVSRYGVMTTSWSFDKVTPICRTVEDCAAVL